MEFSSENIRLLKPTYVLAKRSSIGLLLKKAKKLWCYEVFSYPEIFKVNP